MDTFVGIIAVVLLVAGLGHLAFAKKARWERGLGLVVSGVILLLASSALWAHR